ncbi:hypothetical protein SADO_14053 [Salinisphaera dokdonensis CL-ES53]|uniref:Flagellar basal body rod protein FlgB n=1 Tax=Salinisphaera dokdonensis CL-ES53 TaxID=1304272 RepID=A0ABV2B4Q7_9GAMM
MLFSAAASAEFASRLIDIPSTPFADSSTRLTLAELDQYRGGFVSNKGFEFSFGLTSYHQVNDNPLVAQTLFAIEDVIGSLSRGVGAPPALAMTDTRQPVAIQLGPGNRIESSILNTNTGMAHTIIQNSLDNQLIRNATVYDFQLSNVRTLTNGLNAELRRSMIQRQLVDSIR